ncbi:MAG: lysostaphin resistance A-like protein [Anaerolineae bacterium]
MESQAPDVPAVPWTTRDVWWGLAAFGLWLAMFVVSAPLLQTVLTRLDVGVVITMGELLLLLPVWWLTGRKYGVGWAALGLRPFPAAALGLGLALMLVSFGFNLLYGLFLLLFDLRIQVDLVPIFSRLSSPWWFLAGGAVIAPLAEELFFRGFLFAGLRRRFGWQRGMVISAALFALLHFTPTAILPIFILGCIFAFLYQRSASLWPSILMHMLTNSLALGAAYFLANAEAWGLSVG